MAEKVLLAGDRVEATQWVAYARSRLAVQKNASQSYGTYKPKIGVFVRIKSVAGMDELYIKVDEEPGGMFLGLPASDVAPNGWGEPYKDEYGNEINPPWGTIGGTDPEAIIYPKKKGWGIKRRVPLQAGNMDWRGKGSRALTWWGNPSRYFDGGEDRINIDAGIGETFIGTIGINFYGFGSLHWPRRVTKKSPSVGRFSFALSELLFSVANKCSIAIPWCIRSVLCGEHRPPRARRVASPWDIGSKTAENQFSGRNSTEKRPSVWGRILVCRLGILGISWFKRKSGAGSFVAV